MTEETKQKFITLARSSVRPDKVNEMEALLKEVEHDYETKKLTKSYVTTIGLKIMSLIRIECMVDFIKHGNELAKQVDLTPE